MKSTLISSVLVVAVIAFLYVPFGESIKCWKCRNWPQNATDYASDCGTPKGTFSANNTDKLMVDCNEEYPRRLAEYTAFNDLNGLTFNLSDFQWCHFSRQEIMATPPSGAGFTEGRVQRGCGFGKGIANGCHKRKSRAARREDCACKDGDGCNGHYSFGSIVSIGYLTLLIPLLVVNL